MDRIPKKVLSFFLDLKLALTKKTTKSFEVDLPMRRGLPIIGSWTS